MLVCRQPSCVRQSTEQLGLVFIGHSPICCKFLVFDRDVFTGLILELSIEINKGNVPFWQKTLSGMGSGAIAVMIGTPFDVALVRMQAEIGRASCRERVL